MIRNIRAQVGPVPGLALLILVLTWAGLWAQESAPMSPEGNIPEGIPAEVARREALPRELARPQEPTAPRRPILSYGVDLVTKYVARGEDLHREVYVKREAKEEAFNWAPALQPAVTFHAPGGLSFELWGSFALMDRKPDPNAGHPGQGYAGLFSVDEVDFTIAYAWRNRLGRFIGGLANDAYVNPRAQGLRVNEEGEVSRGTVQELFLRWAWRPVPDHVLAWAFFLDSDTGDHYQTFAVRGEQWLFWNLKAALVSRGVLDVTARAGHELTDTPSVSVHATY